MIWLLITFINFSIAFNCSSVDKLTIPSTNILNTSHILFFKSSSDQTLSLLVCTLSDTQVHVTIDNTCNENGLSNELQTIDTKTRCDDSPLIQIFASKDETFYFNITVSSESDYQISISVSNSNNDNQSIKDYVTYIIMGILLCVLIITSLFVAFLADCRHKKEVSEQHKSQVVMF
ncbi:hypothetical protein ENUP19_0191G0004 [Entamoeba nuttalli]|uniref:Uncharacterized protein n=1 Tax=Entamoeba nuttalli TaxID=412467 RepID=A0ABQ0DN94_9EUKA